MSVLDERWVWVVGMVRVRIERAEVRTSRRYDGFEGLSIVSVGRDLFMDG